MERIGPREEEEYLMTRVFFNSSVMGNMLLTNECGGDHTSLAQQIMATKHKIGKPVRSFPSSASAMLSA